MGVLFVPNAFAEITITDDATGGDCATIGIWNNSTRTCTFTSDLSESVVVGANYLTLDGNGHTLDLGATSYNDVCQSYSSNYEERRAINFNAKTNLVIKNFKIGRAHV